MKLLLTFALLTNLAFAKTFVIESNSTNEKLSRVPQSLAAIFVYQGIKQIEVKPKVFEVTVKDVNCKFASMDVLYPDYKNAGLPQVKCFTGKKKLEEGIALFDILGTIANQTDNMIIDCVMGGRCFAEVEKIKCTSDLNQDVMSNAYKCELSLKDF